MPKESLSPTYLVEYSLIFDIVDRNILLDKLNHYGFCGLIKLTLNIKKSKL